MAPYDPGFAHYVSRDPGGMAPRSNRTWDGNWRDGNSTEGIIVESWSEGFLVAGLLIQACITLANMRKGVLLHKLILLEQLLAMTHVSRLIFQSFIAILQTSLCRFGCSFLSPGSSRFRRWGFQEDAVRSTDICMLASGIAVCLI